MRVPISPLDLKLGARMLLRHPWLSLVGGLAIAFGIAVAATGFEIARQFLAPQLPLPDGERLVAIRIAHEDASAAEAVVAGLLDAPDAPATLDALGAFRTRSLNLSHGGGAGVPASIAEITPAGLALTGVAPLFGRSLVAADAEPGAAAVVVVGEDLWRHRLHADPAVLGLALRVGGREHTVVGVMPSGFAFPLAQAAWVALPRAGPQVGVQLFSRLRTGASLAAAGAQVDALARRVVQGPGAAQLRTELLPYAAGVLDPVELDPAAMRAINVLLLMMLVLVCTNVGMLMFARAALRTTDLAVRTALGASRRRILGQFFAEALVLAVLAAVLGLLAAHVAMQWWVEVSMQEHAGSLPFWIRPTLSNATLAYAAGLAVLVATLAGLLPARKLTTAGLQQGLRQSAAGASLRFGRGWTLVIAAQVTTAMAVPVAAWLVHDYVSAMRNVHTGIEAGRYLTARLDLGGDDTALAARLRQFERALEASPTVLGAAFASHVPRTHHPQAVVELDGAPTDGATTHRVGVAAAAPDFLPLLGVQLRSGRGLDAPEPGEAAGTALVNASFVAGVMRGRNPVGARVRRAATPDQPPGPWLTIVGVVDDAGTIAGDRNPADDAGLYHRLQPSSASPLQVVLHVAGAPMDAEPALRAAAALVDPAWQVSQVQPLDQAGATLWLELSFLLRILGWASAAGLVLSLAGIHAVLAFTVARRTREIGVRMALGARPARVVASVFRHPLRSVSIGLGVGAVLAGALLLAVTGGADAAGVAAFAGYALLMLLVCACACVMPAMRALRVPPSVALREEA